MMTFIFGLRNFGGIIIAILRCIVAFGFVGQTSIELCQRFVYKTSFIDIFFLFSLYQPYQRIKCWDTNAAGDSQRSMGHWRSIALIRRMRFSSIEHPIEKFINILYRIHFSSLVIWSSLNLSFIIFDTQICRKDEPLLGVYTQVDFPVPTKKTNINWNKIYIFDFQTWK